MSKCQRRRTSTVLLLLAALGACGFGGGKPKSEFDSLSEKIHQPDASVRQTAIRSLASSQPRSPVVTQLLLDVAIRDPEASVRFLAASTLSEVNEPEALKAFGALAEDLDPVLRERGVELLAAVKSPAARAQLEELLLDEENPVVRRKAIESIKLAPAPQPTVVH